MFSATPKRGRNGVQQRPFHSVDSEANKRTLGHAPIRENISFSAVSAAIGSTLRRPSLASSTLSYLELIAGIMQEVQRDYVHPIQMDVLAKNALKGMLTRLRAQAAAAAQPPYET